MFYYEIIFLFFNLVLQIETKSKKKMYKYDQKIFIVFSIKANVRKCFEVNVDQLEEFFVFPTQAKINGNDLTRDSSYDV